MCVNVFGMGMVVGLLVGGIITLGAVFHMLENFTLYCVELGLMGWVSICELLICCKVCFNVCGVRTVGFSVGWLCTQMIEVSAVSTYW